jgi:hypothetical protein
VTGLLRSRPAPVRIVAALVAVAGAALLLLGLARATVWAPPTQTVVHVGGAAVAPVVDTTPEALALDGPSLRVTVRAADSSSPVFVGVGRAADVEAYLGGVARNEVTGVRGMDPVLARTGSDASLPEPAGVDVWALAVTGRGTATLEWPQAAGRWRAVAAVDGATPPAQVVLTWQRNRGSSLVPALFAVGGLLLVLGLVGLRATRGAGSADRPRRSPAPAAAGPAASGPAASDPAASDPAPSGPVRTAGAGTAAAVESADDDEDDDGVIAPAPFRPERRS